MYRIYDDGERIETEQQWAEVMYEPNAIALSKNDPIYRYIAIRTPVQGDMFEEPNVNSHNVTMNTGRYRVFGVVTNMDWEGELLPNLNIFLIRCTGLSIFVKIAVFMPYSYHICLSLNL